MSNTAIVTGASSFVGCHLARAFAGAGYSVSATHSRPLNAYEGIMAERLRWTSRVAALVQLDITDDDANSDLVSKLGPGTWVHHAGYATDYASPDYDSSRGDATNVTPLNSIYRAMSKIGGSILITGTNAEYMDGDAGDNENEQCLPSLPYGRSKLNETRRAEELAYKYNVPTRVGRLYIPFGRFDNPSKLLASVQRALANDQPINLSPCSQRRDFIGVSDVCSAWLKMTADLPRTTFDIFNICSGEATELKNLLLSVACEMNADDKLLKFGAHPLRPGEPLISFGENSKAHRLLDWSPRPLPQAIREDLLCSA